MRRYHIALICLTLLLLADRCFSQTRSADDEIRIQQGLLSLETGAPQRASILFDQIPPDRQDSDVQSLKNIATQDAEQDQQGRLTADMPIGYLFSSKLVILDRTLGQFPAHNSAFSGLFAEPMISYTLPSTSDWHIGVRTDDFISVIHDNLPSLSDAEYVASYSGGPFASYRIDQNTLLELQYDAQLVQIPPGAQWGATRQLLTPAVSYLEPGFGDTTVYGQFAYERYTTYFNNSTNLTNALGPQAGGPFVAYSTGGERYSVGVIQEVQFPRFFPGNHSGARAEFGARYERVQANEEEFRANGYYLSAKLIAPLATLGDHWIVDIGGGNEQQNFTTQRRDVVAIASGGVSYQINPSASIRFGYDYTIRWSSAIADAGGSSYFVNVHPYNWSRNTFSLSLQFAW